jgi:alkanesulfonate monooxygenase SsuD/methylene tetrahydromethanopterin reductase-like flavin-dependent oxidoreductase (luciferase family)
MVKYGRSPDQLRLLPGLAVIAAPTETEAKDKAAYYRELLLTDDIIRYLLGEQSGLDFHNIDLDGPLPALDTTDPAANVPLIEKWQQQAQAQKLTVRQVADLIMPRTPLAGSPVQIADHFQHWHTGGASDGFLLTPTLFPNDLDNFVDLVVPELQNRGLFRTEYTGATLRENLGVERPTSPWLVAHHDYSLA